MEKLLELKVLKNENERKNVQKNERMTILDDNHSFIFH